MIKKHILKIAIALVALLAVGGYLFPKTSELFGERTAIPSSGGAAQTPWTEDIDGGGYTLSNINDLEIAGTISLSSDNTITSDYSTSFGKNNTVSGNYSTSFGYNNTSSNLYTMTFGYNNTASGNYSLAFGSSNTASGYGSRVFGINSTVVGDYSTAFGRKIEVTGEYSFGISLDNPVTAYELTASNTMAIMGGNVGIATTSPATALDVNGIIKTQPASARTCNTLAQGGIMYDSDDNHFYGCNGSTWLQLDN